MATEKEKAKVRELVGLALDVNSIGKVTVDVDVTASSIHMRVSTLPYAKDHGWLFYAENDAYFSAGSFSEESFIKSLDGFIAEAKKHHKSFDADGVKL